MIDHQAEPQGVGADQWRPTEPEHTDESESVSIFAVDGSEDALHQFLSESDGDGQSLVRPLAHEPIESPFEPDLAGDMRSEPAVVTDSSKPFEGVADSASSLAAGREPPAVARRVEPVDVADDAESSTAMRRVEPSGISLRREPVRIVGRRDPSIGHDRAESADVIKDAAPSGIANSAISAGVVYCAPSSGFDDPSDLFDIIDRSTRRGLSVAPPLVAAAPNRSSASLMLVMLGVGISIGASGYGGYWFVRHAANRRDANAIVFTRFPPPSSSSVPSAPPTEAHVQSPVNHGPGVSGDGRSADAPSKPVRTTAPVRSSATAQAAAPPVHASRSDDPTVAAVGEPPATSPSPAVEDASSPSFAEPGGVWFVPALRGAPGDAAADDGKEDNAPFRVVTVLDEHARNYHPRVSPDGRLIAFDSDRDGDRGVYVADRDGTNVRRVSGDGFAALPSWSPDGKSLAFVRGEPGDPGVWNLWLRDMASGGMNQLTSYRVGRTSSASWFPDRRRLCYGHRDQLVLLDVTTGTTETIASPRAGQAIGTPTVSPEGRRIIFRVRSDGVWIIDLQSRATRRILDDPTAEEFAWNPGGSQVAYHSRKDGQWRIWVTAPPPS